MGGRRTGGRRIATAMAMSAMALLIADCDQGSGNELSTQYDDLLLAGPAQIKSWVADKAAYNGGFMPTGSAAQRSYVDGLAGWLQNSCASGFTRDSFTYLQWTPQQVALSLPELGEQAVTVAAPITYSGETAADGLVAPLFQLPDPSVQATTVLLDGEPIAQAIANYDVAGRIVIVDMPIPYTPNTVIETQLFSLNDPNNTIPPTSPRVWEIGQIAVPQIEAALKAAGAVGMIAVMPYSVAGASQIYSPLNAVDVGLPGLYLDHTAGSALSQALAAGDVSQARLTLVAAVDQAATMDNLIATIPGASPRTLLLSSHTDGTNALEDDGPAAIQALVDYFCRVPQAQRPATLSIVMDGGHFAGNAGLKHYVAQNSASLSQNLIAAIEIEHLAALDLEPQADGSFALTGLPEQTTLTLSTFSKPPVDAAIRFSNQVPRSLVAPRKLLNFGAGAPLTAVTDVVQLITGPNYLLSTDIGDVVLNQYINYAAMRDQIGGLVQMILDLANTPPADFEQTVADPTQAGAQSSQTAGSAGSAGYGEAD